MKLVVKPKNNNLNKLKKIKADAFIFGIEGLCVNEPCSVDLKKLKKIKNKLHDKEIFVSINLNVFNSDLENLKNTLIIIEDLNIAGIFFYDISLLKLKNDLKLKTPFIWNQNFFVTNYKTLEFYKKLGASGAVISSEITINEIKEIAVNKNKMNLFVNAFGYQMMAFSRRKLISNYFKNYKEKDLIKKHYIKEKENKYRIIEEELGTAILSNKILNTIKEINSFKESGIDYLILNNQEISEKDFLQVLKLYRNAIDFEVSADVLLNYEEEIKDKLNTDTGFLYKKTIYKIKR